MEMGISISRRTRSRSEAYLLSCIPQTKKKEEKQSSETEENRAPMADEDEDEVLSDDECEKGSRKSRSHKKRRARVVEEHDLADENEAFSDDGHERVESKVCWTKVGRPKKKRARVIEEHDLESMLEDWRLKEGDLIRECYDSDEANRVRCEVRFKFEDDDEKSCKEKSDWEKEIDALFVELQLGLIESEDACSDHSINDDESRVSEDVDEFPKARCDRGDHDPILDEQIGIVCKYCSLVILDIKHVLPPFVVETSAKHHWNSFYGETEKRMNKFEFRGSDSRNLETLIQSNEGTVFDLIPDSNIKQMYPHQLEGFEFLWRNIAGEVRIKNLQRLPSHGGRGCIISHAPGTGKTRLTIVFLQTLMSLYPNCRPMIIAPCGMLLSWEQELKKWNVGINFHNLNTTKLSDQENRTLIEVAGSKVCKKSTDLIRYIKLLSWMKGGSILGVGYRLFEGLAGESGGKFKKVLLESPGVMVMDEGHTPRNDQSLMWKALTKVRTRRRVILSGTPFQNNFTELYNTLCLVNPSFGHLITSTGRPGRRGRVKADACRDGWGILTDSINRYSTNDDGLKKLRLMIKPFVHVHRGSILEKTLPGLRDCLIILKPTDLQTKLLECTAGVDSYLEQSNLASLISVHPWLVAKKPEFSDHKRTLKSLKTDPNAGVKTRFLMKLIRLSTTLNEKVLIFSEFIPPLIHIKKLLKSNFKWNEGREIMYIDGNVKSEERQRLIYDFNKKNGNAKVMLASQKACSEGINLVGASRVVLLDVAWNPSVERQAICRAYRLGQEKMVYVYHLVTLMEVNKYERQAEKERISELIFSAGGGGGAFSGGSGVGEDQVLEAMVRQENGRSMFERIVHQPKESDLVNSFGFVDLDD
ncbi:hypothetical protein ACS0TY_000621 [Phlomoides rotata]